MPTTLTIPTYPDHQNVGVVRDTQGKESPITTAQAWAVRRDHILGHLQEVMGPLPGAERRVLPNVEVVETTREAGYTRMKVRYTSGPGEVVPAWLLVPLETEQKPDVKLPAMLCLHQTVKVGKDEVVGLGGDIHRRYALELTQRGYVTIAPDYPTFGEHQIDVYEFGYVSASMKAIWDNLRAVDVLQGLRYVDAGRIGVIGHSLGGHNSIFTALHDQRLKAVVSSCGFNSFPYYYQGNIAGWSHRGYMPRLRSRYGLDLKRVPFDFPELIAALSPRPFFTNSPLRDANFEVEGVRVCMAAAERIDELLGVKGRCKAVYPDVEHDFPPQIREQAYAFLDEILKR